MRRAGIAVAAAVALYAVLGVALRSGPASKSLPRATSVVIVSVPGLQWDDLDGSETPHLDELLAGGTALLSVRTVPATTTRLDGTLTLGAGNRLSVGEVTLGGDGRCTRDLIATADDAADDDLTGAEAGALGEALRGAGLSTAVYGGRTGVAGLMGRDGCVDEYAAEPPAALSADVSLVELPGLEEDTSAAERLAALSAIDAQLAAVSVPDDALVIVVAPAAPGGAAEVTVVGLAADGEVGPWSLHSASTRRADSVMLIDVAPTVLEVLGVDVPDEMTGTPITRARVADDDRVDVLADLADRTEFRDRAVGPVSVMFTAATVVCGLCLLGRRQRPARMLAPVVVAIPIVSFLSGIVAYHRLPLDFYVVGVLCAALVVAAIAVSSWSRWGPWAPVVALLAVLWLVLVIDVTLGGALQINTPLGYSATAGGRFQGFGNLAFALVASSSAAVATVPALLRWTRPTGVLWAVAVGGFTVVAIGAPAFGSDVGGTLAVVPAFVLIVSSIAERRIGWRRALVGAAAAIAVLGVLAAADLARSASSRTHLGRFARRLLDGDAGLVLRRKLQSNLDILTSTFWSFVLLGLAVAGAIVWWRRRAEVSAALAGRPAVRVFLLGWVVVVVLGSLLNDSGIVVFGVSLGVMVPFLVGTLVPAVRREGRE